MKYRRKLHKKPLHWRYVNEMFLFDEGHKIAKGVEPSAVSFCWFLFRVLWSFVDSDGDGMGADKLSIDSITVHFKILL